MDAVTEDFNLQWEEVIIKHSPRQDETEEIIPDLGQDQGATYSNMTEEEMIASTDQMAAENLMFLAQDLGYTETAELADDPNVECVTEEVVTEDWVTSEGQERVEVSLDHLTYPVLNVKEENNLDIPLPTDQDQYTAMRPWPCDFCSRRFRKKAALMNHMVAHQNDRPHACNLCGIQYARKGDLMNHLKVHAFVPDNADSMDFDDVLDNNLIVKAKKKRGRRKKNPEPVENGVWEHMTSARTQQWQRRARAPMPEPAPAPARVSPPPSPTPSPSPPPSPPPPPADPSRPFVCRHCGVGFAREKALQSHSRVHGGDSPVECETCGELCWSRDALAAHAAARHPHLPPAHRARGRAQPYDDTDSGDDMEFRLSPRSASGERAVYDTMRGPELFCGDCGVAFQRADLLRRHVAAAHSYSRRASNSGTWAEHTCEVCGDSFTDALQLLAHAEGHADRPRASSVAPRFKKMSRSRHNTSNNTREFPCRVCGKVFGSRSSQQIHVRIHTGERPYACRFCWKAFADGGTLRKHERIHTGEKPYACAVCPRAFNQRVVLREHVRSHHSAPDRSGSGGPAYCCVVCGRTLHTSVELVQHLIQHCDANTALKRQPQTGPRKYKRRRKLKVEQSREWEEESPSPTRSTSPACAGRDSPPEASLFTEVAASKPPRRNRPRRARRAPSPLVRRPRMIHTEQTKPESRRGRRVTRRPADDLRAIHTGGASPAHGASADADAEVEEGGPFKCEMCALEFPRRDALLLHVPVHI